MIPSWAWYVGAGAVLLGVGFNRGCSFERDRWEDRLADVRDSIRLRDTVILRLEAEKKVLAAQHKVDTLRFTEILTRWKTLTQTVHDTTRDTLTVERIVYLADSTIEACTVAWRGCEALRANDAERMGLLNQRIDGLTRQLATPLPLWRKPGLTLPLGIGVGVLGVLLLK